MKVERKKEVKAKKKVNASAGIAINQCHSFFVTQEGKSKSQSKKESGRENESENKLLVPPPSMPLPLL